VKSLSDKGLGENTLTVGAKEFGEILGLSTRRIQQLAKDGIIIRVSQGKYDLPMSIQKYIDTIKDQSQSAEELDLNREKTLLTRANRQKAEMELKIMRGELHRSEDVESVMNSMLSSFRAQMLVLPGKVAPLVLGQKKIEVVKNTIKKYVYEALQELSDYDPNIFYAKSKDKLSIDANKEEQPEEKEDKAEKGPRNNGKRKTTNG
jgi:phage terminase Nu1 subunit (DNA packaging protein)